MHLHKRFEYVRYMLFGNSHSGVLHIDGSRVGRWVFANSHRDRAAVGGGSSGAGMARHRRQREARQHGDRRGHVGQGGEQGPAGVPPRVSAECEGAAGFRGNGRAHASGSH